MANTDALPEIRQLSASVVNKIAAGEVIERPASVLKELLENAVDAGAQRIEVSVEKGGTELVRITDDGCGMTPEQLPLSIASHATSKIKDADDLFNVATLGFRGEALASIAEVSQFTLRSRVGHSDAGYELNVVGGNADAVQPCGCPVGTTVEVRNLFFNTPVRRKFMRTTQTEFGHCTEAFTRIALAFPSTHFILRHNDRPVYELGPVSDWKSRVAALCGQEIAESLIWVESSDDDLHLSGYVANPDVSRGNTKMQYLFLNGRHIRDRSLQHALNEAYRGLLLHGRHPISFLKLEMPADQIDVNVHPTKLEVRFQDGGRIYSQLLGTLRSRFLSTDLTSRVGSVENEAPTRSVESVADPNRATSIRNDFVQWARGTADIQTPPEETTSAVSSRQTDFRFDQPEPRQPLPKPRPTPEFQPFGDAVVHVARSQEHVSEPAESSPADRPSPGSRVHDIPLEEAANPYHGAIQAHNRYLICESEEGVTIIDQHALHERILYEEIREKVLAGTLETQRLLVPETVKLPPTEAAALLQNKEVLLELGIEVEDFGGDTVLVASYPAMLANVNPSEMIRQLVDKFLEDGTPPDRRDVLDELLHMISCKAAIKAGDRLSPEEIQALIERRHLVQDSHHCPHGRPTTLIFTREELDRRFKRI